MITMNDFFINESAANFNATAEKRDYRLSDGDTVSWQYTSKGLGADLGGVFGNSDTSLKALDVEGGELIRPFDGSVKEYMLLLDGNKAQMKFTPHAANRNYLTKIFLNKYDDSSAEYKRTKTFTVNNFKMELVGPGVGLAKELEGKAEIVGTVVCGDGYYGEHTDEARAECLKMIKEAKPDLLVAGPAFNAGRYGFACGDIAATAAAELNIPTVTAMYPENPGVELYSIEDRKNVV